MSVVSKSSAVDQYHMNNQFMKVAKVGTPMENFTLKVIRQKQIKPLISLCLWNLPMLEQSMVQVDAYLTINKVTLHYINNSEATAEMLARRQFSF